MNCLRKFRLLLALATAAALPTNALACAACYGQSDSPLAAGMNWGILSLLVVVLAVLGSFATFFIVLARRAAATERLAQAQPAAQATTKT